MTHFLHTCFYGNDVWMPSDLNWLFVITKPFQGGWWRELWIGNWGSSSIVPQVLVFQVLCLNVGPSLHSLASEGLSFWSAPAIHPFCSLWLSPSHSFPHSHFISNARFLDYLSLPCVSSNSSFSNTRQIPTLSNSKSYLLFQEAFPDYPSHIYSWRRVYAPGNI